MKDTLPNNGLELALQPIETTAKPTLPYLEQVEAARHAKALAFTTNTGNRTIHGGRSFDPLN